MIAAEVDNVSFRVFLNHGRSRSGKGNCSTSRAGGKSMTRNIRTTHMVRIGLLLSLVAGMVHHVVLYRQYPIFRIEKESILENLETHAYRSRTASSSKVSGRSIPRTTTTMTTHDEKSSVSPIVATVYGRNISFFSSSSTIRQNLTHFLPAPAKFAKLAYFYGTIEHKLYEPVIRAFHSRGWSLTRNMKRAHVLWFDQPDELEWYHSSVKPWQRINQLPNTDKWDDKDSMAAHINEYYASNNRTLLYSFPESYVLNNPDDLRRFQERLSKGGGLDIPWVIKEPTVNQGKGVTIVGPHSPELKAILKKDPNKKRKKRLVVQRYICDEMTYDGRKFDFRVFWIVASVDPLIVLYHTRHNYVRIGHAKYDESNFKNTKSHLTTHTFGADEKKATWDEFKAYIEEFHALQGRRLAHLPENPFDHVQNQIKQILATLVDIYSNVTFHPRDFASQNAFSLHAADMIIDNDLDVFLIEGTDGPGKDEDYDFRIAMHNSIFGSLVDIFEEVTERQVRGIPLDMEDMKRQGVLGDYEVIYDQKWMYQYDSYNQHRALVTDKRGCGWGNSTSPVSEKVSMEKVVAKSKTTAVPKQIAAMGFDSEFLPSKLFYMEGRTGKKGEMVARSFRRCGWTPIDDIGMAQIIYDIYQPTEPVDDDDVDGAELDRKLQPWQFYNRLPMSVEQRLHGWSNLKKYTDNSERSGSVCNPMQFRGREFFVHAYMLVVSWDPLIAYYHDGYLDIPYSSKDENDFVSLSNSQGTSEDLVWRGSWKSFKAMLGKFSTAVTTLQNVIDDPLDHVRKQFKSSLARAGSGLALDLSKILKKFRETESMPTLPRYYGIYRATFQVDRNLNAFLSDLDSWNLAYGESYQDIVDLNDDLFGAAFNLLEAVNSTLHQAKRSGVSLSTEALENSTNDVKGGYELLVSNPINRKGSTQESASSVPWLFEYITGSKASDCSAE
ncbi:tubulin-tyrosine ligase family protein [Nitzschia inconspicua]|uniref:Tubulin--tyrosine ligase-like protein 5 n=1 Tax=Nitzschia inconspicua TaxID=303405 RepID=A0A9K3PRB8_9STRA|nr:tubulin-tyrosine ligase family protein [Nitzschia inconspicua]